MKMMKKLVVAGFTSLVVLCGSAETWTFTAPRVWSRTKDAATLAVRADGALELHHGADQDWSVHGMAPIDVKPGDVFRLSCASKALVDRPYSRYSLSVVLKDANGKVLDWLYGIRSAKPGEPISTEFMIPDKGARIEPRVTGGGFIDVVVEGFKVERLGNRLPQGEARPADTAAE